MNRTLAQIKAAVFDFKVSMDKARTQDEGDSLCTEFHNRKEFTLAEMEAILDPVPEPTDVTAGDEADYMAWKIFQNPDGTIDAETVAEAVARGARWVTVQSLFFT